MPINKKSFMQMIKSGAGLKKEFLEPKKMKRKTLKVKVKKKNPFTVAKTEPYKGKISVSKTKKTYPKIKVTTNPYSDPKGAVEEHYKKYFKKFDNTPEE